MTIFKSSSEKDTQEIAKKIANELENFKIICLYGELGSGKTTFTKSFAKYLGVTTRIISPTYIFVRTHKANNRPFYHIDAYRLNPNDSADEIKEILMTDNAIIVIEWADKIKKILPKKRVDIEFTSINENEREIKVKKSIG